MSNTRKKHLEDTKISYCAVESSEEPEFWHLELSLWSHLVWQVVRLQQQGTATGFSAVSWSMLLVKLKSIRLQQMKKKAMHCYKMPLGICEGKLSLNEDVNSTYQLWAYFIL